MPIQWPTRMCDRVDLFDDELKAAIAAYLARAPPGEYAARADAARGWAEAVGWTAPVRRQPSTVEE